MSRPVGLVLLLSGCGHLAAHGVAPEDCTNGNDDDEDGDLDCDDADCLASCDADGDAAISIALGGDDCDDADPGVNPSALEICDQIDNDCRGGADEDVDGDGAGVCDDCDEGDPSVFPGAAEACGDGLDSDCDDEDCLEWIDGFEDPVRPAWSTRGATPWGLHAAPPDVHEGSFCGQSGDILDGQLSEASVTVTFPSDGTIAFWHKGSTEATYDFLRFYIDDVLQDEWSGAWPWTSASYPRGPGTFELAWVYEKDASLDAGTDTVWIDLVEITGGAP